VDSKKKFAIFYPILPFHELRNQGIARLLSNQAEALFMAQDEVHIYLPWWAKKDFKNICRDQQINFSKFVFRSPTPRPFHYLAIWFVKRFLGSARKKDSNIPLMPYIDYFILVIAILIPLILVQSADMTVLQALSSVFFLVVAALAVYILAKQARGIYERIISASIRDLVRLANRRKEGRWFIPSPHYPVIRELKLPITCVVPDLTHTVYPKYFADSLSVINETILICLRSSDFLVTYSSHVLEDQLLPLGTHNRDSIFVIPNANTIREMNGNPPIRDRNYKYCVYSSQVRPYKNFRNALVALAILNRRLAAEGSPLLHLVTTGSFESDQDLVALARRLGILHLLHSERMLDGKELHSLYAGSEFAFSTSWHEGGFFYFQISEAWMANVPCLLPRVPANLELIDPQVADSGYFFDPERPQAIANCMEKTLKSKEDVLAEQRLTLSVMRRTWKDVGKEYLSIPVESISFGEK